MSLEVLAFEKQMIIKAITAEWGILIKGEP